MHILDLTPGPSRGHLFGKTGLRVLSFPTNRSGCVIKRTHFLFFNNPPYRDLGELIKMWNTNIYSNIVVSQKYIGTCMKVGCPTRSLYASSSPKAEGVPTNNQRVRGSGPCRL